MNLYNLQQFTSSINKILEKYFWGGYNQGIKQKRSLRNMENNETIVKQKSNKGIIIVLIILFGLL